MARTAFSEIRRNYYRGHARPFFRQFRGLELELDRGEGIPCKEIFAWLSQNRGVWPGADTEDTRHKSWSASWKIGCRRTSPRNRSGINYYENSSRAASGAPRFGNLQSAASFSAILSSSAQCFKGLQHKLRLKSRFSLPLVGIVGVIAERRGQNDCFFADYRAMNAGAELLNSSKPSSSATLTSPIAELDKTIFDDFPTV